MKIKKSSGFSFIEILIALAVIAIAFLPLMRMYSTALEQAKEAEELSVAQNLAREEMEKIKNLNFTEAQLESLGNIWYPSLESPPLTIGNGKWRTFRKIISGTSPLEVRIMVYNEMSRGSGAKNPAVELVTLIGDLEWMPQE